MARADLVVYGPGWTIVIEAKIHAPEQREQGRRLADAWSDAVYVFLTRRGGSMRTAGDSPWLAMTWTEMMALVRGALERASAPKTPAMVTGRAGVRDYLVATGHIDEERP